MQAAAAALLGLVHCQLCLLEQGVGVELLVGKQNHAHAGAALVVDAADPARRGERLQDARTHRLCLRGSLFTAGADVFQCDRKLITAGTCDHVTAPDAGANALADKVQQQRGIATAAGRLPRRLHPEPP